MKDAVFVIDEDGMVELLAKVHMESARLEGAGKTCYHSGASLFGCGCRL